MTETFKLYPFFFRIAAKQDSQLISGIVSQEISDSVVEPVVPFTNLSDNELMVQLNASVYLYYFHLISPDERTHFSDNNFDLIPGESRTIRVTNDKTPLTFELVTAR